MRKSPSFVSHFGTLFATEYAKVIGSPIAAEVHSD